MKLDDFKEIYEFDSGLTAKSIEYLPKQIKQLLEDEKNIDLKIDCKNINKIVVNGMGGSNLGSRIIQSVFKDKLSIPIIIEPGYIVPKYVNENTLYIISSYSGGTEEPLSTYEEVKSRNAKILTITSKEQNNKLASLMKKENIPGYIFDPQNNPSNQPRLGVGYSIFGIIFMLRKIGFLDISDKEITDIIENLENRNNLLTPEIETEKNIAKQIARSIYNKQIILVGAEFLEGNLHTLRNQFFENSKNFAVYFSLPELNHYLLEGLSYPVDNKENLTFLFINSEFYTPRVLKRNELTKQVVKKNGIALTNYNLTSNTKPEQSFELLQIGAWITFYLSLLNDTDASLIPWVDWFKEELIACE